jgi:hypothetical protein
MKPFSSAICLPLSAAVALVEGIGPLGLAMPFASEPLRIGRVFGYSWLIIEDESAPGER